MVHPNGKWLYASNRGQGPLCVYLIDENDPTKLSLQQVFLPFFLFLQFIGIILYLYFLIIIFKGNSKNTLKFSETNGNIFNKVFFFVDFESICKIIIIRKEKNSYESIKKSI